MISIWYSVCLALFWGFCYRCRGGPLSVGGDFHQRIVWWSFPVGLTIGLWGFVHGAGWLSLGLGLGSGILAYIGTMLGHAKVQNGTPIDLVEGIPVGIANTLMIFAPVGTYQWFTLHAVAPWVIVCGLSGATMALAYFLGYSLFKNFPQIRIGGSVFLGSSTDWGEFITMIIPAFLFGFLGF